MNGVGWTVDNPVSVPRAKDSGKNTSRAPHLLIVEDDPKLSQVLKRGLEEKGFDVDLASTGPEGIDLATSGHPDAILLDLMLPGKDGFIVIEELRSKGLGIPIVLMTGRSQAGDALRGRNLGVNDFLHKPFQFQELLARLLVLLRPASPELAGPLRVADLELDISQQSARRGGRLLNLTAPEFSLLEYFVKHEGLTLTKTMIQNQLWGYDYSGGIQLVEVYVNRIKSEMEQGALPPLIHTRGIGFEMKAGAPRA